MAGKPKTVAAISIGYAIAVVTQPVKAVLDLNVQKWAEASGYDKLYEALAVPPWVSAAYDFIAGPFGLGFVLASLIFGFWDPVARYGASFLPAAKRRKEAVLLSVQCRELAGDMNQFLQECPDFFWPRDDEQRASHAYQVAFQAHYDARAKRYRARFATRAAEMLESVRCFVHVPEHERMTALQCHANTYLQEETASLFGMLASRLSNFATGTTSTSKKLDH